MTSLTMDGGNRIVGTEFVKLLITGSSNLATEEYVDNAVLGGGGGSVDAYTKTKTDNLLNAKLDVNNPQDIIGNLRLDSTNGNSKLIINAVAPATGTDDFYCNGSGHFNGSLRVSVLTSDGDVNADGCNADTFNSHIIANDIIFKHNDVEYQRFNQSDDSLNLSKNLDMKTSTLKTNTISTNGLNDMVFNVDTLGEFFRFQVSDNTVRVPNTRSLLSQNLFTDIVKPLAISNDITFQGQNTTDDNYEEYFRINSTTKKVDFNKPISSITCNEFNSDGNVEVVFKRNTDNFIQFKTDGRIHIPRQCFFASIIGLDNAGSLSMVKRPESSIQVFEFSNTFGSNGKYRFKLASNNILEMTTSLIQATRNLQCDAGIKTNTINSNGDNNLVVQRNGSTLITLNSNNEIQLSGDLSFPTSNTQYIKFPNCNIRQGVATIVYFDFSNDTATGQYRFFPERRFVAGFFRRLLAYLTPHISHTYLTPHISHTYLTPHISHTYLTPHISHTYPSHHTYPTHIHSKRIPPIRIPPIRIRSTRIPPVRIHAM